MKTRCVVLAGSLALVFAQGVFAQSVQRRPCMAADAPSGCEGTMPGPPKTMMDMQQPPERRQTFVRVPLSEQPPPPPPADNQGTVSVKPAPDAEPTVQNGDEAAR